MAFFASFASIYVVLLVRSESHGKVPVLIGPDRIL